MELWVDKVIAMVVMFFASLFCGLIPIQLMTYFRSASADPRQRSRFDKILSLMNCLCGGVFIGTTFLHLFPEVKEQTENYLEKLGIEAEFALTEFIVCMGFLFVMTLEHLIMSLQHSHSNGGHGHTAIEKSGSHVHDKTASQHSHYGSTSEAQAVHQAEKSPLLQGRQPEPPAPAKRAHDHETCFGPVPADGTPSYLVSGACVHVIEPTHHAHHHMEPGQLGNIRSFILLLAMSLHTIFEGLAVGLERTSAAVWNLFIAIIIHKCIIAFSLGVQFVEHLKFVRRAVCFIILFSIMSPIGLAIGTVVISAGSCSNDLAIDMASGILQSLATGILIYVAFFEVLLQEVGQDHSLLKVLFVILGFGIMTLLNLFNHEPHGAHEAGQNC